MLTAWLAPRFQVVILTSSSSQCLSTRGLLHAPQGTCPHPWRGTSLWPLVCNVLSVAWPGGMKAAETAEVATAQCDFSENPQTRRPNTRLQQVGRPAPSRRWLGIRLSRSLYVEGTGFPSRAQEGVWRPTVSLTHVNECMFSAPRPWPDSTGSPALPWGRHSPAPCTNCVLNEQIMIELF